MKTEWDIKRLQLLLDRYATNTCTPDEKVQLEHWYETLGNDVWSYYDEENMEKLKQESWETILNARQVYPLATKGGTVISLKKHLWKRRWVSAAAVFIVIAGISAIFYAVNENNNKNEFATNYGVIDTLVLPDNSVVVLNANSKLKYNKKWSPNEPRELWLQGEGFFDVKHLNNGADVNPYEQFIVHVKNATIEVLGTIFNVRERRGKTEIVLQQGKIRVTFEKPGAPGVIMQPGQIMTIDSLDRQPRITNASAEDYLKWREKKLELTNATLKEIVEYLEDNYGKRIILSSALLDNRKIGGTFRMDNLDDALFALSKALNLEIVEDNNTLYITPK